MIQSALDHWVLVLVVAWLPLSSVVGVLLGRAVAGSNPEDEDLAVLAVQREARRQERAAARALRAGSSDVTPLGRRAA